jgi:hypothetical protein
MAEEVKIGEMTNRTSQANSEFATKLIDEHLKYLKGRNNSSL